MPPRRRKQGTEEPSLDYGAVQDPVGAQPVEENRSSISTSAVETTVETNTTTTHDADGRHVTQREQHHRKHRKSLKQSRRLVFFLGALLGIVLAWYFAAAPEFSLESLNDLNLDSFAEFFEDMKGKLPYGMLQEANDISQKEQTMLKTEAFAVGKAMYGEGLRAKYPVIMVPGVISTGLESWSVVDTDECSCEPYFRRRLWGSWNMLRAMLLDKTCWLKHIMLDPHTGLDPRGYKLRAAQGLEAADFFITGYWIWNKILENLAAIAYDPNMMHTAAYDWRLSYMDLELRDGYFSRVKSIIEENKHRLNEKTVLVSHSMGSQVIFYFFKWVEASGPQFGNGGKNWVNDHIHAFVDISGSSLGTPKSIVALLSGEMKDTVQLNALAVYGLEKFFSRSERALLLRSFPGIASMLPKGGEAVWGSLESAIDDPDGQSVSYGNFIQFRNTISELSARNLTVPESIQYLFTQAPGWFQDRVEENYSHGLARTKAEVLANEGEPRKWINPLEVALPNAPDLRIFCLYGVGKPTERAYLYQEEKDKSLARLNVSIAAGGMDEPVIMGEGDGTVSLITHSMCHRWRDEGSKFNPGASKVTIVEMPHEPERFDVRGGPKTAEHVDILGRAELNELVLKIVAGKGEQISDRFVSNLKDYAARIDLGE
ncbi:Lecithin:cholesterol acyltransferase-domain-containing protein [Lipomyces orientalis]|uniref:Lecithin:cholesterol acyltransferase-domain-containing protein n=1 Tax=Lipomyces orientalis TaxID=1233043 RepID=A0ACC3TQL4_9ASCO